MKEVNGKWTFSRDEENFCNDEFDTRNEAIEAGRDYYDSDPFYVGQIESPGLGVTVDVSAIFERINENMCDKCGEWANDYLMDTKQEHNNELEQELCEVIARWIERYGYQPTFYTVTNIEEIEGT